MPDEPTDKPYAEQVAEALIWLHSVRAEDLWRIVRFQRLAYPRYEPQDELHTAVLARVKLMTNDELTSVLFEADVDGMDYRKGFKPRPELGLREGLEDIAVAVLLSIIKAKVPAPKVND